MSEDALLQDARIALMDHYATHLRYWGTNLLAVFVVIFALIQVRLQLSVRVPYFFSIFFGEFLKNKLGKDVDQFLEQMDGRKIFEFCKNLGLLMSINSEVHMVYDIRLKYSHVKMQSILGQEAEVEVKWKSDDGQEHTGKLKDDEILSFVTMQMSAEDDSFALLEKTEKILNALSYSFETKEEP